MKKFSFFPGRITVSFRRGPSGHLRQDPSDEARRIKDNPSLQDKSAALKEEVVRANACKVVLERGGDLSDKLEVLGEYILQFGKYKGRSFQRLLDLKQPDVVLPKVFDPVLIADLNRASERVMGAVKYPALHLSGSDTGERFGLQYLEPGCGPVPLDWDKHKSLKTISPPPPPSVAVKTEQPCVQPRSIPPVVFHFPPARHASDVREGDTSQVIFIQLDFYTFILSNSVVQLFTSYSLIVIWPVFQESCDISETFSVSAPAAQTAVQTNVHSLTDTGNSNFIAVKHTSTNNCLFVVDISPTLNIELNTYSPPYLLFYCLFLTCLLSLNKISKRHHHCRWLLLPGLLALVQSRQEGWSLY